MNQGKKNKNEHILSRRDFLAQHLKSAGDAGGVILGYLIEDKLNVISKAGQVVFAEEKDEVGDISTDAPGITWFTDEQS